MLLSIFGSDVGEKTDYVVYEATAYCYTGRTASGSYTRHGVIATDPRVLKLGTRVEIRGMGQYTALDTGSAIKGRKIDVYMKSCQAARNFGRRKVYLRVL